MKVGSAVSGVIQWVRHCPTNQKVFQFPVRARTRVAGLALSWGCARHTRLLFLSYVDVSLPLSPSLPLSLKISKLNLKKKKKKRILVQKVMETYY